MFTARPTENQIKPPAALDVLLFQLAGELYALPSADVREVIRYRTFTPVPGAPPTIPGILSQRGSILPVVALHPLLGLESAPITRATRLVIVAHDDIGMALLAETVLDLVALPAGAFAPVPAALDPAGARFLGGLARYDERLVALLDLAELIAGLQALG